VIPTVELGPEGLGPTPKALANEIAAVAVATPKRSLMSSSVTLARHRGPIRQRTASRSADQCSHTDQAELLSYSSWRRNHRPVSLRPFGARSSHWYMPQRTSAPRA
jgi:hypothetical protein